MNIYSPSWLRATRSESTRRPSADQHLVIPAVVIGIIIVAVVAAFLGAIR